jgi:hypothetical protein
MLPLCFRRVFSVSISKKTLNKTRPEGISQYALDFSLHGLSVTLPLARL